MFTQSKPMTYLSLKTTLPMLPASKRIALSLGASVIDNICKKLPMEIKTLRVDSGEIRIDKDVYKFKRLMSFYPTEKTEFIQLTVNGTPTLIRTKAPVKEVMKVFLEKVFGGTRPVKIDTWELGFCPVADIKLNVEHVKLLGRYYERVLKNMISPESFPLTSVEVTKWGNVPDTRIDAYKLIAPIKSGNWKPIFDAENYWIHVKSVSSNHSDAEELVNYIMGEWEIAMSDIQEYWTFDVSTEFYKAFMKSIYRPGRFIKQIRNGVYTLQCANDQIALHVFTSGDKSALGHVELHFQSVEFEAPDSDSDSSDDDN